jgi:hypothetical protein
VGGRFGGRLLGSLCRLKKHELCAVPFPHRPLGDLTLDLCDDRLGLREPVEMS